MFHVLHGWVVGATLDLKGFLALSAKYSSAAAGGFPAAHASKYLHDRQASSAMGNQLADLDYLDAQNRGGVRQMVVPIEAQIASLMDCELVDCCLHCCPICPTYPSFMRRSWSRSVLLLYWNAHCYKINVAHV